MDLGSKSSSSTTKIAKWLDTPPCSCPRDAYEVYKIRIKSVPMAGEFWISIANIITLGWAKKKFNSQQYSHDCLELSIECTICKCTFEQTMQFNSQNKFRKYGRYRLIKSSSRTYDEVEVNLDYERVLEAYQSMPNSGYDLAQFNCKHWARKLWQKLQ